MLRKIIKIDEEKCIGCGACVTACHEGAIEMVNGKAKLTKEDYCDGLGDCLPSCPTNAISFELRESLPYDEQKVLESKKAKACSCPGSNAKKLVRNVSTTTIVPQKIESELQQWPCQIRLVPVNAPYFDGAHLLIAADCTAYAYANFHTYFMKNKITLIGCPKLDNDYTEKLTNIIAFNDIQSVTIVRMEVPCCGGLENQTKQALKSSKKFIPWGIVTISTDGRIL